MGKVKKIIAIAVTTSLIVGGTAAGLTYVRRQNVKTVNVCKVGSLASNYYFSDETSLDASVTSSVQQNVSIAKDMIIDKIYVSKGETVKTGQELVSFDTTLIEMKLNIERLKREKMAIDLGMSMARLQRLRNGGAITESDLEGMGTQDSLPSTGSSADDAEDDDDDIDLADASDSLAGGSFFAAATRPIFLLASALFSSDDSSFGSDETDSGFGSDETDYDSGDDTGLDDLDEDDLDEDDLDEDDLDALLDGLADLDDGEGMSMYRSEDEDDEGFSSGGSDPSDPVNAFGSGGSTGVLPYATPTPGPDEPVEPVYLDEFTDEAAKDLGDGEEAFYTQIDWSTIPLCGNGSENDPFVYLCSSARGRVYVTGGFLNVMAGYSPDGSQVRHEGGYWYQLEFHQNDTIADFTDRTLSCTGYYLINGSLLISPVDQFITTDFTVNGASKYTDPDMDNDDLDDLLDDLDDLDGLLGDLDDSDPTSSTTISRNELIRSLEAQVMSLELDLRESEIGISKLEKQVAKKVIYSKLDGTVSKLSADATSGNLMTIKSGEGYFVRGSVSELLLDDVVVGTRLNCMNWTSGGSFEAEVMDISEYPAASGSAGIFSEGNPNVSYYTFTANILDKDVKVSDSDWLNVTMQKASDDSKGIVLEKAFVRSENGNYYVYKDDGGVLKKQYVSVKANVDSGYSVLIGAGLRRDDLIAFPYGETVTEGAKTVEVSSDVIYGSY
ncbi:MAG: hypothetical protein IKE03_03890 [Blautia sp.]|nr:hypothetical protein [Blautia sp.]